HRPTALAVVLDNSQSTALLDGDRRVLDRLTERVRATLRMATAGDRIALFPTAGTEPSAGGIAGHLRTLETLTPAPSRADLPGTLAEAQAWLA
ncbi:MAG: hypothetical protein GWN71_23175, partial [Gammaproteobacteria bacterium]|nr:hypothetical protein [Gammaproteobacteria bacterium]